MSKGTSVPRWPPTLPKYKAWNQRILTCRVNPHNTSRECARCHGLVARYHQGQPAEGYTEGAPLVCVISAGCRARRIEMPV